MTKPEWGLKRACQSCGAKFYDMARSPIVCPKCGATFDPETMLKTRRPKAAAPAVAKPAAPPEPAEPEVAAEGEEKEEEEEAVMEDTSELGSEDEDVADVVENADDEKER